MSVAPAPTAASATDALRVSTETRQWAARASMTGTTRCRSSAASTASAPGRVDSPPTSITSAPAAIMLESVGEAAAGSNQRPPSENESGVTFRTPITKVTARDYRGGPGPSVPWRTIWALCHRRHDRGTR